MNIKYIKWLDITIHHDYFSAGKSDIFSLVPLTETRAMFDANNIRIKKQSNVFLLFIGVEEGEHFDAKTFFKDAQDLQFQLILEDSLFYNYIDINIGGASEILSFKNSADTQQLLAAENFEVTEHVKITEQISSNCLAIITLDCNTLFNDGGEEAAVTLHFSAREVYIKYYFVSTSELNVVPSSMIITGLKDEVFIEHGIEELQNNQMATVFISSQPIPAMLQSPSNRTLEFYRSHSGGQQQKMNLTLPNPEFNNVEIYQTEDGTNEYSTSVYVYI